MPVLQKDETLSASAEIRATPDEVYALASDVTRIPQWSPETMRVQMLTGGRFRSWNRRRLALWRTDARMVEALRPTRVSFIVTALGGDWTQWTYRIEPGPTGTTTTLTEEVRMCVRLPLGIVIYEHLFLLVRDRRPDLQRNLQVSVERIRAIVESQSTQGVS